jgi:cytochrome P450
VICDLLGVPDTERTTFRRWSNTILSSDGAAADRTAAGIAMAQYLGALVAEKRAHPADDMLSAIVAASEDADRLSPDETVSMAFLLLVAGHETTVNLIGNGTLALLRHREQLERLAADPSLDAAAVDELLRYDTPVQVSRRIVTTDIELAGQRIAAGELVMTLLGSANRDEAKWGPTAADLDLGREGAGAHLAFGSGIHHCLGSALARLEGAEAVPTLVRRFPAMELATDAPAWNGRIVLRGLDSLPVVVAPG